MMLVWQWRELMNKYILTKRQVVNELSTFYSFLLGFLIALMIGSIILLIQDKNPFDNGFDNGTGVSNPPASKVTP